MARLAAVVKGLFYPVAPSVPKAVAKLLRYTSGPVLDPCAGEGEAVEAFANGLGAKPEDVYAIELETARAEALKGRFPEGHVLAPASTFDCRMSFNSCSVAWLNPPFDTNVGGGRVEALWLETVAHWLAPGGVLCFVIPESYVESGWDTLPMILTRHFERLAVLIPSDEERPFNEVVVVGSRRKEQVPSRGNLWRRDVESFELANPPRDLRWLPAIGSKSPSFVKTAPTDEELREDIGLSPLAKLARASRERSKVRPPLPLSKGHLALLLASGQLDGIVHPPGEEPHVVRGTATKVKCPPEVETETLPDGGEKTVTIIKEQIKLVVRAVWPDGLIKTLE